MAERARAALVAAVLGCVSLAGCGEDTTLADGGANDASAGSCTCVRPQDCPSGVCCVETSGTASPRVARTYCVASEQDCPYVPTGTTTKTIACTKDSDCATEVPDGGRLQYPSCVVPVLVPCSPSVCILSGSG